MAKYPWRFQAEIKAGETDPMVTVFMGAARYVLDDDGNPTEAMFIEQNTSDAVLVKLSELPAAIANPTILDGLRKDQKTRMPGMAVPPEIKPGG